MHGDHRVNRLKLHELQVLLAVAQAGSMAKAAAQLAMSEPAVSRSISDMERTLGVSLFDRSSKGVKSTPYGRALIKRGVAVFDELRHREGLVISRQIFARSRHSQPTAIDYG
jgi:DNA-binding transcriptional LysR family regulator